MVEIDTSELKGKWFKCIDGCGLCCLCQPELLPPELKSFRRDPALSGFVARSMHDPSKRSIAMLKNGGPCALLRDRKCTIYSKRPHFCRQFPVHTHLMWRIQLTPDYSCRGIWREGWAARSDGFVDLEKYGLDELHFYTEERLEAELRDARNVFDEFRENAIEEDVWTEIERVREKASSLIDGGYFSTLQGMGAVLSSVSRAREGHVDAFDLLPSVGRQESLNAAMQSVRELSEELLTVQEPEDNPVYVDSRLDWNIFGRSDGAVWRRKLLDSGGVNNMSVVELNLDVISLEPEGEASLAAYARKTNKRDAFLGFVYYLVDDADYDTDIAATYMENMAMTQLDLVLRTALISPGKASRIGSTELAEGIVYIDMDMHDAPTIGSVI